VDQEKTVQALQTAIKMETDGKAFYLKASLDTVNPAGKALLASLATEEDIHRAKFEEIFQAISKRHSWPDVAFKSDNGKALKTLFAQAVHDMGSKVNIRPSEMDAIQTAMDMENKTYDFYQSQLKTASYPAETEFYAALSKQEKQHHIILQDYYEFLRDPAQYYQMKEHHSLDG